MSYPLRFPLSILFAKLGATLSIEVNVFFDKEAGVYIATSKDVPGLVIEAESLDEMKPEITEAIHTLLELKNNKNYQHTSADVVYRDHIALA